MPIFVQQQGQSCIAAVEAEWPAEPKIFAMQPSQMFAALPLSQMW
jgi:hypothetical protein